MLIASITGKHPHTGAPAALHRFQVSHFAAHFF